MLLGMRKFVKIVIVVRKNKCTEEVVLVMGARNKFVPMEVVEIEMK